MECPSRMRRSERQEGHELSLRVVRRGRSAVPPRRAGALSKDGRAQARPATAGRRGGPALPGRPAETASAEQMKMNVKHGLPGPAAIVEHNAVTIEQLPLARNLCRHQQNVPALRRL